MDAKLQGSIKSLQQGSGISDFPEEEVVVLLELRGKVLGDFAPTTKDTNATLSLRVRKLVASQLKWGETLYVTVSTTRPPEPPYSKE